MISGVRPQWDGPWRLRGQPAGGRYWTRWAIIPDQINWRKQRRWFVFGPTVPSAGAEAQGAGRDGND